MDSSKNTWSSYTFDLNNHFDKNVPNVATDTSSSSPFKTKWTSHINPFGKGKSSDFFQKVGMYILVIGSIVFLALLISGYSWSSGVLAETTQSISGKNYAPRVTVTPMPTVTPYGVRPYNEDEHATVAPKIAGTPTPTAGVWSVKAANDF